MLHGIEIWLSGKAAGLMPAMACGAGCCCNCSFSVEISNYFTLAQPVINGSRDLCRAVGTVLCGQQYPQLAITFLAAVAPITLKISPAGCRALTPLP